VCRLAGEERVEPSRRGTFGTRLAYLALGSCQQSCVPPSSDLVVSSVKRPTAKIHSHNLHSIVSCTTASRVAQDSAGNGPETQSGRSDPSAVRREILRRSLRSSRTCGRVEIIRAARSHNRGPARRLRDVFVLNRRRRFFFDGVSRGGLGIPAWDMTRTTEAFNQRGVGNFRGLCRARSSRQLGAASRS